MIERAILFAAGLGTRMRPLTDHKPKALIEVGGKPLLAHALEHFEAAACTRVVVNTHHHANQVADFLAARASPCELVRSHEELLLETGGAVVQARAWLGEAPFFAANTDVLLADRGTPALTRLRHAFDPLAMDALLLLQPRERLRDPRGNADFGINSRGELMRAEQRPYAYTGFQVLHPRLFAQRALAPFSLRDVWFAGRREDGSLARIYGLVHEGDFLPVGTPDELREAERWYASRCADDE